MSKQTAIIVNGKSRNITDFMYDGMNTVTGRISGRDVSTLVPNGTSISLAKRALIGEHDRVYGNRPLTKKEVSGLGLVARKAKPKKTLDIHFRSEKLADGSLEVTGIVNGEKVMLLYDGIVVSEFMELSKGRPFITKIREDLRKKYDESHHKDEPKPATFEDILVNADFMDRFKGIATVAVGQDSMIVYGKPVYLKGLTITEALEKINGAIDEHEARKERLNKMINDTISRLSA